MGCKSSTEQREIYNEDINIKHRFLAGIHISKDPEGIEGNIQIALGTIRKKKYERVANIEEEQQTEGIEEPSLQAISEAS